jgi:hypothetical protein
MAATCSFDALPFPVMLCLNITTERCGNSNTLSATELQHGLHILSKERGFDGEFIRVILLNEFDACLKDELKFLVMIIQLIQL